MNVILRGRTKQVLENMVEEGYANTQSEAVRLAVIQFGKEHFSEVELVNRKLDKLNKDIDEGKSKLLTPKQALGKYTKFLK